MYQPTAIMLYGSFAGNGSCGISRTRRFQPQCREKVSNNVVILSNNVVILSNNVVIFTNNDVILTLPRSFRAERTALWPVFPVSFPIICQWQVDASLFTSLIYVSFFPTRRTRRTQRLTLLIGVFQEVPTALHRVAGRHRACPLHVVIFRRAATLCCAVGTS